MALRYPQVDYYANFDDQITVWSSATSYSIGDIVTHIGLQWRAVAANSNSAPSATNADWEEFDFEGEGYYQFVSLENIIDNFMFTSHSDAETMAKKMIDKVEVDFWAQRVVQEFAQDVFSVNQFEYELVDSLTAPMPQDLTKIVSITYLDERGVEQHIQPRRISSNPPSATQASDGAIQFKANGDILFANDSEALRRYNQHSRINQSGGGIAFGGSGGTYFTYGKRWYLQPENAFSNGTYVINKADGTISFDTIVTGETIVITYISDGLSENFAEIKVPKACEDAIDTALFHRLIRRSGANLYDKQKAEKEASSKMRNAKIRLMDYSPRNMIQALRGNNKWIRI